MGRAAQLWKSQEALTEGLVNEKLSIQEQLQVKIALRMMRKSHTKTAKSEAERKRLKQQGSAAVVEHIGEPNYSSVQDDTVQIRSLEDIMKEAKNNFNMTKDKRKMDKASTKYGQLRPIFPHLVEEIRIEQEELQRLRDEREENEVDSMGSADADGKRISRPSRAIINAQKRKLSRRPQSAGGKHASITNAQKMLASKEAPGKLDRGSMIQKDGEGADRSRMLSKASLASVEALHNVSSTNYRRQELVPIRSTEVLNMNAEAILAASEEQSKAGRPAKELQQHLQNAQQMHGHGDPGNSAEFNAVGSVKMKTSSSTKMRGGAFGSMSMGLDVLHEHDEHTVGSGSVHLSRDDPREAAERMAALYRTSSPSPTSSERCMSPSQMLMRQNSSSANLAEDSFFGTAGRPVALLRQMSSSKRSSFFSSSAVKDDERISRAQQQRDDIQKTKEDELRQRIRNKELLSLSKAEMMVYEQRQRAWAIAIVALARWSLLSETLTKHRTQQEMWETNKATKKAIGFIERWWRRGRVRMIIKRNPHVVPLIRRVIMPLVVRLRLARKRCSANLIITFLQDSTGMSETMRAIYAFRQTAIRLQRWIKSWIEIQHCRMRILWLKCERMYRERTRAEGGDDKKAGNIPVLPHVNMFAGTADELGTKKKQLARLLEDQENARLARVEEARFQEEILQKKKKAEEDRILRHQKLKHIKKTEHKKGHKKGTAGTGGGLNQPSVDSTALASSAAMSLVSALPAYLLSRTVIKKAQAPWHKRIRTSASNIKIYDLLREVLKYERRRHVLNLVKHKRRGDGCLVGTAELKKFLRNPHGYDGVTEISKKLAEVQVITRSPAQMYKTPFLLLTQGGIESIEMLLATNRYIKF